jgi:hypothetical protein
MTAEALVLHAIDDIDSKLAVVRALKETGKGFVWARSLDRFVWLGDGEEDDEPSEDSAPQEGDSREINGAAVPANEGQRRT